MSIPERACSGGLPVTQGLCPTSDPAVRGAQGREPSHQKENMAAWLPLPQRPAFPPQPPLAPALTSGRSRSIGLGHEGAENGRRWGFSSSHPSPAPWVGNALLSGRCPPCWWLWLQRVSVRRRLCSLLSACCPRVDGPGQASNKQVCSTGQDPRGLANPAHLPSAAGDRAPGPGWAGANASHPVLSPQGPGSWGFR